MAAVERGARAAMLGWLALPAWLRRLAPFVVMGSLWISSSVSPAPRPPDLLRSLLHNSGHVVVFAILAGTLLLAHPSRRLMAPIDGQPKTSAACSAPSSRPTTV